MYDQKGVEDYKVDYDAEATEAKKTIEDTFDYSKEDEWLTEERRAVLDEDFEKVSDISFIQHSNGREVEVYQSKTLKGAYILYDGEYASQVLPNTEHLRECKALYAALDNTAFVPSAWIRGYNDNGVIICTNREYSVLCPEGSSMFSIRYDDVEAKVENLPIKAMVYERDGVADKVEIISICTDNLSEASGVNVGDVRVLLEQLGLGDESADLADEWDFSLGKKSYKRTSGAVTVESNREVRREKDMVYNVFSVKMG
jgi:hypothetical protein